MHVGTRRHALAVGDPVPAARSSPRSRSRARDGGCTFLRSWQDFDLVMLALLPMFLFSGTFFPISLVPGVAPDRRARDPAVPGCRPRARVSLGAFDWAMLGHVAYLVVMSFVASS